MPLTKPMPRLKSGAKPSGIEAEPRFVHIGLSTDGKVLYATLQPGGVYEMPIAALSKAEDWDGTEAKLADTINHGYGAMVKFESGNQIDFPADFILHICEPAYPHHISKGHRSKIGARVKALREQRGLSLRALQDKCGIAYSNLSRLERNTHTPSMETLGKVGKALGVTVAEILA